jgi:hypothetical protein
MISESARAAYFLLKENFSNRLILTNQAIEALAMAVPNG